MSDGEGRFQVAGGAVIEHARDHTILIIYRSHDNKFQGGNWEFVYGRCKQFEDPESGLKREVSEEIGIKDLKIIRPLRTFHIYRGKKNAANEVVGITYCCRTNSKKLLFQQNILTTNGYNPKKRSNL